MIGDVAYSQLSIGGLLAIAVLLVFSGGLTPWRQVRDIKRDRDEWRAALKISEAAREVSEDARGEMAHQVNELLEHARTTDALIRAMSDKVLQR